jgi:ABC-type transport system involved in multi-copper enzyme maturation permease subunit
MEATTRELVPPSSPGNPAAGDPIEGSKARTLACSMAAAFKIALARLFWSRFMLAVLVLGALPVLFCCLLLVATRLHGRTISISDVHDIHENLLHFFDLHFVVFFLANILGFAVVRQEIDGHSLHYLLLQPAPRWAIFTGRFLAFLTLVSVTGLAGLWLGYGILMLTVRDAGAVMRDLLAEGRLWILAKESAVLILAMIAYGSVAMAFGSYFKSAAYAIFLLVWESVIPYLPQALKDWTIFFNLQSLLPDKPRSTVKMFELLGTPAPAWQALAILGGVSVVAFGVALAFFQFRECQYADD